VQRLVFSCTLQCTCVTSPCVNSRLPISIIHCPLKKKKRHLVCELRTSHHSHYQTDKTSDGGKRWFSSIDQLQLVNWYDAALSSSTSRIVYVLSLDAFFPRSNLRSASRGNRNQLTTMAKSRNGLTAVGLSVLGGFLVLLAFTTESWLVTDGQLEHPKFERIGKYRSHILYNDVDRSSEIQFLRKYGFPIDDCALDGIQGCTIYFDHNFVSQTKCCDLSYLDK